MIGHFADSAAEARFRAAYAAGMSRLPEPAGATVVPTDFGRVHVHHFGTDPRTPLVLLPGRSGSTAMWAPNLPAWAAQRTVHAVEVLGEAGLSVQTREIRNTGDQAAWLAATLAGRSRIHHPRKAYERARSLLPDGHVELWPAASHAISGEFADKVNERILQFVGSVEQRWPA